MKQVLKIALPVLVVIGSFLYISYKLGWIDLQQALYKVDPTESLSALDKARKNYGGIVSTYAVEMDLPESYFLALIVLECSGENPAGSRFEPHVFKKLKAVQSGRLERYENIDQYTLHDATEEALKNLATSWGPFQLMGYKCVGMDVNVKDIRGEEAVLYGMKWINEEYGSYLRKRQFADAFHLHNTGRSFPQDGISRTHDPKYVQRGVRYVKLYEQRHH